MDDELAELVQRGPGLDIASERRPLVGLDRGEHGLRDLAGVERHRLPELGGQPPEHRPLELGAEGDHRRVPFERVVDALEATVVEPIGAEQRQLQVVVVERVRVSRLRQLEVGRGAGETGEQGCGQWPAGVRQPHAHTRRPFAASREAAARPIPVEAPVTRTVPPLTA